eukprot:2377619-Amphidinium_carterae.1
MTRVSSEFWAEHVIGTHISHYESMYSAKVLEEVASPSVEMLVSLLQNEPGKISATLERHAPTLFARVQAIREMMKKKNDAPYDEITETWYHPDGSVKRTKFTKHFK